jgi:hypothetical protein
VRTALLSGFLTLVAYLLLYLPGVMSNVDFTYMAVGAAMLFDGKLPASPYFPPGYSALIWALMHLGLTALNSGAVLAALGIALLAGSVSYVARLWAVPAAPALMLGLLAASLPSTFIVGVNPHLDALYAGLGAVLLAGAMRAFAKTPSGWTYFALLLCAVLMLSLRYHATLVVIPVALVLSFSRKPGVLALGLTLLLLSAAAVAASLYALHNVTGSTHTAALDQVRTGSAYRALKNDEDAMTVEVYDDYAAWQKRWPAADLRMVLDGIVANFPSYISRKSIIAGAALWLLGLIFRRREAPGALWLPIFIIGYTLAISPTYYITRASVLPEAAGVMLAAAGIAVLFFPPEDKKRRRKPGPRLDPAIAGALLSMAALAGLGYNAWRERPILAEHYPRIRLYWEVNKRALELVGGDRRHLYGVIHSSGIYGTNRFNLPAVTWSRLWMDDPAVAPMVGPYLPREDAQDVLAGRSAVTAILIWKSYHSPVSEQLSRDLPHNPLWQRVEMNSEDAQLWRRVISEKQVQSASR